MTQLKPPAVASWMFRHLVLGNQNESLEGDLLEEFQRRGSIAWYWRQVLAAIFVSLSGALRAHWLALIIQLVFATAWALISPYCDLAVNGYLIAWGLSHYHFAWVVSIARFSVLFVALPLAIYLIAARRFSLRTYARGLAVGWSLWAIILYGGTVLLYLFAHGIPLAWGFPLLVCSLVVPLLIAIWVALASQGGQQGAKMLR